MSKKVSDILPKTEILAQLAEEASELAQAALKLRRALDGTNPTPKSVEECQKAFEEEYADVVNCIIALDCICPICGKKTICSLYEFQSHENPNIIEDVRWR